MNNENSINSKPSKTSSAALARAITQTYLETMEEHNLSALIMLAAPSSTTDTTDTTYIQVSGVNLQVFPEKAPLTHIIPIIIESENLTTSQYIQLLALATSIVDSANKRKEEEEEAEGTDS